MLHTALIACSKHELQPNHEFLDSDLNCDLGVLRHGLHLHIGVTEDECAPLTSTLSQVVDILPAQLVFTLLP
jgi:hypothetical protein